VKDDVYQVHRVDNKNERVILKSTKGRGEHFPVSFADLANSYERV